MPAIAYAMSDLIPAGGNAAGHISRPVSAGGCGQEHEVQVDRAGRAYIECDACAPSLIGGHHGWAARPGEVPLTPDELAEQELAERDAKGAQNTLLKAMTDSFVKALQGGVGFHGIEGGPAPQPKSLAEQIAELDDGDKAALRALLAPPDDGGDVNEDTPSESGAHVLTPPEPPKATGKPGGNRTAARSRTTH